MYPQIDLSGGPRERGLQYGKAARDRILRSLEGYERTFEYFAGWNRSRVREEAEKYWAPISAYDDRYVQELVGIAEGAGVDERDVLAINCRTEIMFAAKARTASNLTDGPRVPLECSAFAALPHRTADGRLIIGQTWDWLTHATGSLVTLRVRQSDGPNFVTVAEAGLLAKFGMNSSGLAVCTNALVCDADKGEAGVPYHVLLRALLESESLEKALTAIIRQPRASSANFLLASADGIAINVEAAPGDHSDIKLMHPENGVALHTNHFLGTGLDPHNISIWAMPDSPFRLARLRALVEGSDGLLDRAFFQRALADHAEYPSGVCCHPDPSIPGAERYVTAAAVVMDPAKRQMWLTEGPPCENDFELLDLGDDLVGDEPVDTGQSSR